MNKISNTYEDINDYVDYNSKIIIDNFISKFALENSNIGVWDFNALNRTVNYSIEAQKILDLEQLDDQTQVYNWQDRIHPEDLENVLKNLKIHLDNKAPNYVSEHRILTRKGNYKWIKDIGKVVTRDVNGKHIRIIGTIIDIDKRKKQESNITEKQSVIKKQNEKLKNFAFIATHNLKSHAANFESLLNFYDEAKNDNEKKEVIDYLKTISNSLTKTIKGLNRIVSTESSKDNNIETIDVNSFVNDAIKALEIKIKNTGTIINKDITSNLSLEQNPAYFESILQNLISNAIKYRHKDRTPVINIKSQITEDHIIISFNDNGLGIDLNKYGNDIFSLYKTFHNNDNAEGVGLYLTKNQVEAFDGVIEIESQVNIGSTFTIKYPNKKSLV